ncbi:MAG: type II toxin-antitoxin system PemK/MazF family toxin [Betaproteobacteria bacterium]
MRRGEIWVANLNPINGNEAGKIRPVVIVQEDRLTADCLPTVVVIPLITQLRKGLEPLRIAVRARERLAKDCHVMTEQMRTLDRSRLRDGPLTRLTGDEMAALQHSLLAILGML